VARFNSEKQNHGLEKALDNRLIELAAPALERGEKGHHRDADPQHQPHRRHDALLARSPGRYGHEGLPRRHRSISVSPDRPGRASAPFLAKGVTLDLVGDTNDYCAKGLSGGRISVQPSPKFRGEPTENIITGNVVLYGAIAGEAYFPEASRARDSQVRNSGAHAVVEGVGDHGCEYMTGGLVAVLGGTGRNFAAGMSGGLAYVLDLDGEFNKRCNTSMVDLEPLVEPEDEATLRRLIENHSRYTGSKRAQAILAGWGSTARSS
jgi:glutamate synthase (NADPH/NADH) large chain